METTPGRARWLVLLAAIGGVALAVGVALRIFAPQVLGARKTAEIPPGARSEVIELQLGPERFRLDLEGAWACANGPETAVCTYRSKGGVSVEFRLADEASLPDATPEDDEILRRFRWLRDDHRISVWETLGPVAGQGGTRHFWELGLPSKRYLRILWIERAQDREAEDAVERLIASFDTP